MQPQRIIIYAKDVQRITGKSRRYGYHIMSKVRARFRKDAHQLVTVHEFCEWAGLPPEELSAFLT